MDNYDIEDARFDAEQLGKCPLCLRDRDEGCRHCEGCGLIMHIMIEYVELSDEEWSKCTIENGYKIVGRNESGYSMDGPNGDLVMWCADDNLPYRVYERLACANPACDNYDDEIRHEDWTRTI